MTNSYKIFSIFFLIQIMAHSTVIVVYAQKFLDIRVQKWTETIETLSSHDCLLKRNCKFSISCLRPFNRMRLWNFSLFFINERNSCDPFNLRKRCDCWKLVVSLCTVEEIMEQFFEHFSLLRTNFLTNWSHCASLDVFPMHCTVSLIFSR